MTRLATPLLLGLALAGLACGKYGPPQRPPAATVVEMPAVPVPVPETGEPEETGPPPPEPVQ